MARIELRTNEPGDVAQLLIDGRDVSHDATAVSIHYDCYRRPRGFVTITYKTDQITVDGNFINERTDEQ